MFRFVKFLVNSVSLDTGLTKELVINITNTTFAYNSCFAGISNQKKVKFVIVDRYG